MGGASLGASLPSPLAGVQGGPDGIPSLPPQTLDLALGAPRDPPQFQCIGEPVRNRDRVYRGLPPGNGAPGDSARLSALGLGEPRP